MTSAERCCVAAAPWMSHDQLAQPLAAAERDARGPRRDGDASSCSSAVGPLAAQLVEAAVVGDPVQPRAQRHRAAVGAQRAVGADQDVLDDVLGGCLSRARAACARA